MDKERLGAVDFLDVRLWDTRLEIEYGVGIKLEDRQDAIDFCVL